MLLLLIPMVLLYELGIVAVRVLVKPRSPGDTAGQAS
jgi:Sec-independent protein secretion pathway component TatC